MMDKVKRENMDMEKEMQVDAYTPYEMSMIMERMHAINTSSEAKDYGTGEMFYSVEIHILSSIAENPGISVTELARKWNRTKGAVSQILKKLESKELIYRKKEAGDKRKSFLYASELGMKLHEAHVAYDTRNYEKFFEQLTRYCTQEQIWQTFGVLEKWIELSQEWHSLW